MPIRLEPSAPLRRQGCRIEFSTATPGSKARLHTWGTPSDARRLRASSRPTVCHPWPQRPTSWQTFLRAHWGAIACADFFTTEVWTLRGLVTYYTLFVIDLASRRVRILGSTRHPDAFFMHQTARTMVTADEGALAEHWVLICDRDAKWTHAVRGLLAASGVRVVQTPYRAPNANAHAERFVRSIKEECLDRLIPLGDRHFRQAVAEFVSHYHHERPHHGCGNAILAPRRTGATGARLRRYPRLGGLLNYYARAA